MFFAVFDDFFAENCGKEERVRKFFLHVRAPLWMSFGNILLKIVSLCRALIVV